VDPVFRRPQALKEQAGQGHARRVTADGEASPLAAAGVTAVGGHDEPGMVGALGAILPGPNRDGTTRRDADDRRPAPDGGSRLLGRCQQRRLHLGVIEAQHADAMRRGLDEVAPRRVRHAGDLCEQVAHLTGARVFEQLEDAERARFGHAPAEHRLAAHAVLEFRLPLEDQDASPCLGECLGERGAGQPPADNDEIMPHEPAPDPESH
jgi:hypothetical protein